jgi:hypothetical protein
MGALRREAVMKTFVLAVAFLLVAGSSHAQSVSVNNRTPPGAFEVVSKGGEVSLSSHVQVQRLFDGTWQNVADVQLMRSCNQSQIPACVTLGNGEHLQPPPWNGYTCASQCPSGCRANILLPPGTFRFVVTLCSGGENIAGPAFNMEAPHNQKRSGAAK